MTECQSKWQTAECWGILQKNGRCLADLYVWVLRFWTSFGRGQLQNWPNSSAHRVSRRPCDNRLRHAMALTKGPSATPSCPSRKSCGASAHSNEWWNGTHIPNLLNIWRRWILGVLLHEAATALSYTPTNVCQVSLASSFCTCTWRVMALEQSTALGDKCKLKPVTACGSGFGLVFTTSVLGIELQDVWFGSAA